MAEDMKKNKSMTASKWHVTKKTDYLLLFKWNFTPTDCPRNDLNLMQIQRDKARGDVVQFQQKYHNL